MNITAEIHPDGRGGWECTVAYSRPRQDAAGRYYESATFATPDELFAWLRERIALYTKEAE